MFSVVFDCLSLVGAPYPMMHRDRQEGASSFWQEGSGGKETPPKKGLDKKDISWLRLDYGPPTPPPPPSRRNRDGDHSRYALALSCFGSR